MTNAEAFLLLVCPGVLGAGASAGAYCALRKGRRGAAAGLVCLAAALQAFAAFALWSTGLLHTLWTDLWLAVPWLPGWGI